MSRLIKKFLGPDSVDGSKIKLLNGEALRAQTADGQSTVEILKVNSTNVIEFVSAPIIAADPVGDNDLARKKYVDDTVQDAVDSLINGAPAILDTLKELADALGSDTNWATSVATQLADIKDRLDTLEGDATVVGSVAKAEADAKAYADNIEQQLDARLDTLEGDATVEGSVAKAEADAKAHADNIEQQLDARLDVIEGDATVEGSVAKAEADAKAYADDIQTALDARLDVLEGADTVAGSVAKAQKDAQDFATALDTAMDARVDALESYGFIKEKKSLGATEVTQGYVDLGHEAKAYSTFVFVQGGLYLYEGDDYTLSNVGGVTRLTFAGAYASAGATPLADGDVLLVQYQYQSSGGGGGGGNSGGQSPTLDLMSAMESGTDYAIYWNATNTSGLYVAVVNDGPGWSMAAMAGAADQGYANVNKSLLTNGNSYRIRLYTDSSYTTPVDPSVISSTAFTASISGGGGGGSTALYLSQTGNYPDASWAYDSPQHWGMHFIANGKAITKITMKIRHLGGSGMLKLQVKSAIEGTVLAESNAVDITQYPNMSFAEFTFASPATIPTGQDVYVYLSATGGTVGFEWNQNDGHLVSYYSINYLWSMSNGSYEIGGAITATVETTV